MQESKNNTALVLAAHGARSDHGANALIHAHARRIVRRGIFDEVAVAFNLGRPRFSEVLDQLNATDVTVVPVMTANGHFCERVLPEELAKNRRYGEVRIRQTLPIGLHPAMPGLVLARVSDIAREHRLDPSETLVMIVGHGARDHAGSRRSAEELADALRRVSGFAQVEAAFLEETPSIEEVFAASRKLNTVVVPFLIGGGQHVSTDIPEQLGVDPSRFEKLPIRQWVDDRLVICDVAVGTYPGIVDLIIGIADSEKTAAFSSTKRPDRCIRVGMLDRLNSRWCINHVTQILQAHGVQAEAIEIAGMNGPRKLEALDEVSASLRDALGLRQALIDGEIDLAVQDLRDLDPTSDGDVELAAVLPRAEVTESLVSARNVRLASLPANSLVGVTNELRAAQLHVIRPDLRLSIIKTPVEERLSMVREGALDATVVATASLRRLGLLHQACETFSFDVILPAACQGIVGVQALRNGSLDREMYAALDDHNTRQAALAERRFVNAFDADGSWQTAAYAVVNGDLSLRARVVSSDGHSMVEVTTHGADPREVADSAIRRIREQLATARK